MDHSIRTITSLADIAQVLGLDDAKTHLRVDFDDDDLDIAAAAAAAQGHIELSTGQILSPREMEISWCAFPRQLLRRRTWLRIPCEPITAITAIAYTDTSGQTVELDESAWRWNASAPEYVRPAIGTSWPRALEEPGSVRVTFEAGYGDDNLPSNLLAAVKLMTGHLYANREAVALSQSSSAAVELPLGVQNLCADLRRRQV